MMREIVEAVKQAIVAAASVDFQTGTKTTP
jgi:hypothetical protein